MNVTEKTIENLFGIYYAATEEARRTGNTEMENGLADDVHPYLSEWQMVFEQPSKIPVVDEHQSPTVAYMNANLAQYGYKGVGGKNPRVIKISKGGK